MTSRERIMGTLLGRPTDRAPFGVGIGFFPWAETLERWRVESGLADLDPARVFGYDPGFDIVPAEYGPLPHFETRIIEESDEYVVSMDFRGLLLRNRRDFHSMPEFIAHPVRDWDDWRRYKEQRLQPMLDERLKGLEPFAARAATGEAPVQVGAFPWGVFGTARDMLGAEELLLSLYTEPELVSDIMATYVGLWLALYERIAARIPIDHIHIWEDMCARHGSLISMAMVEEFMMPHYDRIAAFARERGVPLISVDSDGLVDELVGVLVRHGVNAFLPFEAQAGSDIEAFRRRYPDLGIIGGLDKNALADGRHRIHRELDRAERMLAAGRYVPGLDHLVPPNVSWESFEYFILNLKRIVGA